jgi:hypothetical protein
MMEPGMGQQGKKNVAFTFGTGTVADTYDLYTQHAERLSENAFHYFNGLETFDRESKLLLFQQAAADSNIISIPGQTEPGEADEASRQ